MIPEEKSAAVTRGVREAFGLTEFEDVRELVGGPGFNPVFRIVVRGSPFLLRINLRAGDLARHYSCMKAAAGAGLAPHVWYTSVEDRISITDFVQTVPFPRADALVRMAAVLRRLHALPPFPGAPNHINTTCTFLMNKGPALDGFVQRIQAANILPKADIDDLFAWHAQLAEVYPRHDPDMVSSHNDLFKPDNILFDGNRVWLVDWEAAFLNDRYADLAVVANMLVINDTEERLYLQGYFGQPPDEYQQARFFLMQQVAHMFYAMAFLLVGSSGKQVSQTEARTEFKDFHQRFWAGDIKLTDNGTKTLYGKLHWGQLLRNVQTPRYTEALRIVSDRHPRYEAAPD